MSTPISVAAAAPKVVVLNGTEWKFSPIRLSGFARIEQWARSKVIEWAVGACRGLDAETRERMMELAFKNAAKVTLITDPEDTTSQEYTSRIMNSLDGVVQLLHASLVPCQPSITLQEVEGMLDSMGPKTAELADWIMRVSGMKGDSKNPKVCQAVESGQPTQSVTSTEISSQ